MLKHPSRVVPWRPKVSLTVATRAARAPAEASDSYIHVFTPHEEPAPYHAEAPFPGCSLAPQSEPDRCDT